jgi:hypothetical protein
LAEGDSCDMREQAAAKGAYRSADAIRAQLTIRFGLTGSSYQQRRLSGRERSGVKLVRPDEE